MHYSDRPNDSDWRDSSLVEFAVVTGVVLAKYVAPGAIVLFMILRWLDGEGFPVPWDFFIFGLNFVIISVIIGVFKAWSGDSSYETSCGHVGVRNGKPCIRHYGHSGQHRYR